MWVNVYMPTRLEVMNGWNAALATVAAERPDEMVVYDWAAYAASNAVPMMGDFIHETPDGSAVRAVQVALATQAIQVPWASKVQSERVALEPGVASGLVALTPQRALDTRVTADPMRAGEQRRIELGAWIPAGSTAAAVNVTVTQTTGPGFVTAWDCERPRPETSIVNFGTGATAASAAIVPTSGAAICLYVLTTTHVVIDVTGAFAPDGLRYRPAAPDRLLDSRSELGSVPAEAVQVVQLPHGARAAVLNLTAVDGYTPGYITVWPCGTPRPTTSNLNLDVSGGARANLAIVAAGTDGTVCLFNSSPAETIVDLFGTFDEDADLVFKAVDPTRLLDTRAGVGGWRGRLAPGREVTVDVDAPAGSVIIGTITAVSPARAGYVAVWNGEGDAPGTSNLNYATGQTIPNLVVAELGDSCSFAAIGGAGADVDVVFDVTGVFVDPDQ